MRSVVAPSPAPSPCNAHSQLPPRQLRSSHKAPILPQLPLQPPNSAPLPTLSLSSRLVSSCRRKESELGVRGGAHITSKIPTYLAISPTTAYFRTRFPCRLGFSRPILARNVSLGVCGVWACVQFAGVVKFIVVSTGLAGFVNQNWVGSGIIKFSFFLSFLLSPLLLLLLSKRARRHGYALGRAAATALRFQGVYFPGPVWFFLPYPWTCDSSPGDLLFGLSSN